MDLTRKAITPKKILHGLKLVRKYFGLVYKGLMYVLVRRTVRVQ